MLSVPAFRKKSQPITFAQVYTNNVGPGGGAAGVNFGADSPSRYIIASFAWFGAANMTGCTIGGVVATAVAGTGPNNSNGTMIWIALVPTGATGTVQGSWDAGLTGCAISVYRATNLPSATPLSIYNQTGGGTFGSTLTTANGGFALGALQCSGAGGHSWSGIVQDSAAYSNGGVGSTGSVATTTPSLAWSAAGNGSFRSCSAASWG